MPNNNLTSFNVIIDRSGSMMGLVAETVGGFNKLLEDQKKVDGECMFSLTLFDNSVAVVHDSVDLKDVPPLTEEAYREGGGGWTALNDALGMTVLRVFNRIKTMPEDMKPGKVLFTVITDGQENASKEYVGNRLRTLIEKAREQWQYEFTMIGANIDSVITAKAMGMDANNAINYNATKGAGGMMDAVRMASVGTQVYREQKNLGRNVRGIYGNMGHVGQAVGMSDEALRSVVASSMSTSDPQAQVVNAVDTPIVDKDIMDKVSKKANDDSGSAYDTHGSDE
jgi:hypothetical protein